MVWLGWSKMSINQSRIYFPGGQQPVALIEAEKVTKRFGGLMALREVDFHIDPGEILGLIGPNGAGKTTLFNTIAGVFPPDGGRIRFNGEEIGGLRPYELCSKGIARTFQITKPFLNITVLENMMVGALCKEKDIKAGQKVALEILEFVGLAAKKDLLAANLTLEDRKRLELARALATKPTLLLLDEVMAGLTAKEVEDTLHLIRRVQKEGVTIFLVEHVMKAIMAISHRVMVLHHGEKIAEGTPGEIVKNQQVIDAYLGQSYRA
jgi:branched-chain amino acid transport system ATP-binding protein